MSELQTIVSYQLIIEEFNKCVIASHNAHYENNPYGLIDVSANASPNGNQIYHLYSSGEITHQKGAWAYLKRSEFQVKYAIYKAQSLPFKFVHTAEDNTTYVILTEEECNKFRNKMESIINLIETHIPI